MLNVPAGEGKASGGLDWTGNHEDPSSAHHILEVRVKKSSVLSCSSVLNSSFTWCPCSHPCVCGCSLPRPFGRGSLDDRRTQTQAADSVHCRTWTLLWSSSLWKHTKEHENEQPERSTWASRCRRLLTVSRQYSPVLSCEAGAGDAAVRAEGDPHCAAVCVDRWWCYVSTEPAGENYRPELQLPHESELCTRNS